ncbi:MAG: NUDIX domain-containing protein, partial [Ruminiclostridium sp.]
MPRTEKVEFTNMCMIYDGDKVLVQDKISRSWGGLTFPGGHVEEKEDFTDAVIREVYEET